MCIPLSLLGNGSVKTLPRQRRHAMREELLEASFSMRSMLYQRKVAVQIFPELLVSKQGQQAKNEIRMRDLC
jgi:hypothetical protein